MTPIQRIIARNRPTIEEDHRMHNRLWGRRTNPLHKLLAPFDLVHAPFRVHGHNVTRTQTNTAIGQAFIDELRHAGKPFTLAVANFIRQ